MKKELMRRKSISDVGESAFIGIIRDNFAGKDKNTLIEAGDDCFCFRAGGEKICVTKDMLVEDVHFNREWTSPCELAIKAVESNVSDIAAMGAVKPAYLFVALGLSKNTPFDYVKKLYSGIKKACDGYSIIIAGGDTVKSEKMIISITLVATAFGKIIRRNGAKRGDIIGVTNSFGEAGAGVDILYKYGAKRAFSEDEKFLISRQNRPKARLEEGAKLSEYVTAMTDASDGLHVSIDLIANESGKGADITLEKIPLSKQLKNVVKDKNKCLDYALFGQEDFELVFTVRKKHARLVEKLVPNISYIGKITNSNKVKYFCDGKEQKIRLGGYKHF
jgi:thiamine-monophosphate kinase